MDHKETKVNAIQSSITIQMNKEIAMNDNEKVFTLDQNEFNLLSKLIMFCYLNSDWLKKHDDCLETLSDAKIRNLAKKIGLGIQ